MDIFPDSLDLEVQPDGFHYKLLRDFEVIDDVLGKIVAKAGEITDLGSIPRIFWSIIPPNGKPTDAYVIHDHIYSVQDFTREQADDCLLRMMTALGVKEVERLTIWGAVRAGGEAHWNEHKKKEASQ